MSRRACSGGVRHGVPSTMHSWKCSSSRENDSSYDVDAGGVRLPSALAAAVDRRVLPQPRRRERERAHRVGEDERDRLAVLERVEQPDPGDVAAGAVREPERPRRPRAPRSTSRRQRPRRATARPCARAARARRSGRGACCRGSSRENARTTSGSPEPTATSTCSASASPRRVDQVARDVGAADDLAGLEVGLELGVVDDDADVAEVGGRPGQLGEHRARRPGRSASSSPPGRRGRRGRARR